jgi:hypothetical protein
MDKTTRLAEFIPGDIQMSEGKKQKRGRETFGNVCRLVDISSFQWIDFDLALCTNIFGIFQGAS